MATSLQQWSLSLAGFAFSVHVTRSPVVRPEIQGPHMCGSAQLMHAEHLPTQDSVGTKVNRGERVPMLEQTAQEQEYSKAMRGK